MTGASLVGLCMLRYDWTQEMLRDGEAKKILEIDRDIHGDGPQFRKLYLKTHWEHMLLPEDFFP